MTSQIDQLIVETVIETQGLKATELGVRVAMHPDFFQYNVSGELLVSRIYGLIEEGELVGVDYVLPEMPNREKTLVLPKDSKVTFVFPKGTQIRAD